MDSDQVRAQMKATRDRIDHTLDVIQKRAARSRGRRKRIVLASGAVISLLFLLARRRQARRRAREHKPA